MESLLANCCCCCCFVSSVVVVIWFSNSWSDFAGSDPIHSGFWPTYERTREQLTPDKNLPLTAKIESSRVALAS